MSGPSDYPQALVPRFAPEPNANIVLYDGAIEVTQRSTMRKGMGQVLLRWLPAPQIRLAVRFDEHFFVDVGEEASVLLVGVGVSVKPLLTGYSADDRGLMLEGILEEAVDLGDATAFTSVQSSIRPQALFGRCCR
ncbi:MAG: hypothetical protein JWN44_5117 [Myxococcales bacterium]|nr:hypothetical protein [Myxococcales bacterium]